MGTQSLKGGQHKLDRAETARTSLAAHCVFSSFDGHIVLRNTGHRADFLTQVCCMCTRLTHISLRDACTRAARARLSFVAATACSWHKPTTTALSRRFRLSCVLTAYCKKRTTTPHRHDPAGPWCASRHARGSRMTRAKPKLLHGRLTSKRADTRVEHHPPDVQPSDSIVCCYQSYVCTH